VPGIVSAFEPDAEISLRAIYVEGTEQITGLYSMFLGACSPIKAARKWPIFYSSGDLAFAKFAWYELFSNPTEYAPAGSSTWVYQKQSDGSYLGRLFMFNYVTVFPAPQCILR